MLNESKESVSLLRIQMLKRCSECGRAIGKDRSTNQNRYYWILLSILEEETGNDKNLLHNYFKDKYLPREILNLGSTVSYVPKSTTQLTTGEMETYLLKIRTFAAEELQINLPLPNMPNEQI